MTIAEGERQRHDASQPNEQLTRNQPSSLSSRQRNHHAKEEIMTMEPTQRFRTALVAGAAASLTSAARRLAARRQRRPWPATSFSCMGCSPMAHAGPR